MFFLAFLVLVLLASFGLLAWRADQLRVEPQIDSVGSPESAFC